MIISCKDCANRQVGCHTDCAEYLAFKAEREEIREIRFKYGETQRAIVGSNLHRLKTSIRRRR